MEIKILVLKFQMVDGKKTGRSFSFKMDPHQMAQKCKTEATVRKRIEEYVLKNGPFKRSELPDLKYDMKEFLAEWRKQLDVVRKETEEQLFKSENNPSTRITPDRINRLAPNEVFVFGSNAQGMHGGGAARQAAERFGAIMGQGHGPQGMCYAINSMSGLADMKTDIAAFTAYASEHPEKRFLVTLIGCGIAGYTPSEVAPLFECCKPLENVCLPAEFWKILGQPAPAEKHYDLDRFLQAQQHSYKTALDELAEGHKHSHWIWYIFPQKKGLGHSQNSEYYGLDGTGEAAAYLAHPVLGPRLRECCQAVLQHQGKLKIEQIMGSDIDVIKLQSSMNLFNKVAPNDIFATVLKAFF